MPQFAGQEISRDAERPRPIRGGLLLAVCLLAAGCSQSAIRAGRLPSEYAAPRISSAQHLDLSRLAGTNLKNEVVYPGDTLSVSIATGLEARATPIYSLRVSDEGVVNVPIVGAVQVGGLDLTAAEALIAEAGVVRGIYRNPQVSLGIERRRSNKVTVVGAVAREGSYELPSNQSDLLSALVAAGGMTKEADTVVEIRRPAGSLGAALARHDANWQAGGPPPAHFAGHQAAASGMSEAFTERIDLKGPQHPQGRNLAVDDGAVVMVMRRPRQSVHVLGLVKRPGQFEIQPDQDLHVLDAIALAGGRDTELADKVLVIRQLPDRSETVPIEVSLREAKRNQAENLRLAPGDVVSVEETPLTFTLRELQRYIRFSVTAASRFTIF